MPHTPRRANQGSVSAREEYLLLHSELRGSRKNSRARKEPLTHNEHFWVFCFFHIFFLCERVNKRGSQQSRPHHISQFRGRMSRASPALAPSPLKTTPPIFFFPICVFKVQSRGHSGCVKTVFSHKHRGSH